MWRRCASHWCSRGESLKLPAPVEIVEEGPGVSPSLTDFDEQFEEHFGPEKPLDFIARRASDSLQHSPTSSDQDRFLSFAFAVDGCRNACETLAFFELIHDNRCSVRD